MAYIGRDTDKISNVEVLDNITFDGSSSYTLQKNSVNFTPSSANTILLSIDGVVQAGNFTVSGSTIDFGTAVAGTSTCDFVLHYGVGLITTPSDGTVTTAKLADSSVSLAKLTATGTKSSSTFLRGDNTFAAAGLNGWSENGSNNDLLPANASAGIYLGVNSATASNLLDDYEEGTWTPSDASGAGLSFSNTSGNCFYTKIGNVVTASFRVTYPSTATSNNAHIGGLPFTAKSQNVNTDAVSFGEQTHVAGTMAIVTQGNTNFLFLTTNGSSVSLVPNSNISGKDFRGTVTYKT